MTINKQIMLQENNIIRKRNDPDIRYQSLFKSINYTVILIIFVSLLKPDFVKIRK